MIIAFIGNDGSGKTTVARKFQERLRNFGFDAQYRMEFNYFLISHLFRLFGKERVEKYRISFLVRRNSNQKPLYIKAWPYLVWFDLLLEWLWCRLLKRDNLVVMDRYAYDFLMSWEWLGYDSRIIRWLYLHFPRPDLAFFLDVSASIAFLRKESDHIYTSRYYTVQRKRYLRLAEALDMKTISTEQTVEECVDEVFEEFQMHFVSELSDENKVLLFYSFPESSLAKRYDLNFVWSDLDWNYIVDVAVKSNVETVLCQNILDHCKHVLPQEASTLLEYVLDKSNQRVEMSIRTLESISRRMHDKRINFIVMKTIAPFDYGGTDLDILVERKDFEPAKEVLSSIFKVSKSSQTHKAITYQGALLPVDLHYEISWLGYEVIDSKKVFMRRRKISYNGVELFVPSPEDELLIALAHSLFQHHYTVLGDLLLLANLLSSEEIDMKYVLSSSARYKWRNLLESFLLYQTWALLILNSDCLPSKMTLHDTRLPNLQVSPIFFHRFDFIPKKKPIQILDLLVTFLRRLRFRLNRKLAYNFNWLKDPYGKRAL